MIIQDHACMSFLIRGFGKEIYKGNENNIFYDKEKKLCTRHLWWLSGMLKRDLRPDISSGFNDEQLGHKIHPFRIFEVH